MSTNNIPTVYMRDSETKQFKPLASFTSSGTSIDDTSTSTDKTWSSDKINSSLNNIANEIGRNEDKTEIDMGTTATTIRGAIKELKDNQNSNGVTQEQIDSAVTSYLTENPVTGGLTSTAKNLLITILRKAVYDIDEQNKDEVKNMITELETSLASSTDTKSYNITNTLTNVINSNSSTIIEEKASYNAILTTQSGYSLSDVTITMGGTDITSSCYSDGAISISEVTGDIVITANATQVATIYTIEYVLGNCVSSNKNVSITENDAYSTIITPSEGYVLNSAEITMNGTDITSSAYNNGVINISQVTGNLVITVNAVVEEKAPELVTDGLENYFDFRTATYNNSGSGGSTIVNASQGNGSLYCWATGKVTEQGQYGMKIGRAMLYAGNGGTTGTTFGSSFTWIFKCYMTSNLSPLFSTAYALLNNLNALNYQPKYNTSSGTAKVTGKSIGNKGTGYKTFALVVDGNICKLYQDSNLLDTVDGSTIDGFVSWYGDAGMSILGDVSGGYYTQVALYNKALSEVQLVDMLDYLKSLEVA